MIKTTQNTVVGSVHRLVKKKLQTGEWGFSSLEPQGIPRQTLRSFALSGGCRADTLERIARAAGKRLRLE